MNKAKMRRNMRRIAYFVCGIGSVLNIAGVGHSPAPVRRSDLDALRSDWVNIGRDLALASNQLSPTQTDETSAN